MDEMSVWDCVKLFFNGHRIVKRKDYMSAVNAQESLLDTYRCYLMRAGYLTQGPKAGIYIRKEKIPLKLTVAQAQKQAYPRFYD